MWRTFDAFSQLLAKFSLVIKITLIAPDGILCKHTRMRSRMVRGASKHSCQLCGTGGWKNQIPQWVLVSTCQTADLSVCQSGKWNVKNDLRQAQCWVKALLFKALSWV